MNSVPHFENYLTRLNSNAYRSLTKEEISILIQNQNHTANWNILKVADPFNPSLIRQCEFMGAVYLDAQEPAVLEVDGISFNTGIFQSTLANCHIGSRVCIRNVHLLSGYRIENNVLLFNIDELSASGNSAFGQGFVHQPEDERNWIELVNENGGRQILPFAGMLPADAFLWAKYRADSALQSAFVNWTDRLGADEPFQIATIGSHTSIRNCRTIQDTWVGSCATIESASRMVNVTIQSDKEEPTTIGSGADLRNGVVGPANEIYSNVIAENFCTGRNVHLKYGVRFINNYLGTNSTISCCEVLSNLLFPFHEQHHNNSFLIATMVMGQDNIAAGATIGSNHNSRAADGEIWAKRGFWPGLVTNFKHNSAFASFTLIAKGNYNAELNVHLPFTLVSPAADPHNILLFPGFWFKYNMYALARNTWKFKKRDKRKIKQQHIEMDYLAPDTIEEMFHAVSVLQEAIEKTTGKALSAREITEQATELDKSLHVELNGIINKGKAQLLKPAQGLALYHKMILFYAIREILPELKSGLSSGLEALFNSYSEPPRKWMNLGGQIIPEETVRDIRAQIADGRISSWNDLHAAYDKAFEAYNIQRRNHALFSLMQLFPTAPDSFSVSQLQSALQEFKSITSDLLNWTFSSREKDYTTEFRKLVYDDAEEMEAVLGSIEENPFLSDYKKEMETYITEAEELTA